MYDLYFELQNSNTDVIIDDRTTMTIGKRLLDARRSGYPFVIIIGNMSVYPTPLIEVHNIYSDTSVNLPLEDVINYLKSIIESSIIECARIPKDKKYN